jgi:hypothetical protein
MTSRRNCGYCHTVFDADGADVLCPACKGKLNTATERQSRIARGDLNLCYEDITAAEQAAVIRARRRMNISGA